MILKNKKGFLLAEETLKIVIAVIAIGLLIYLLFSLYYNSQKNEKLEQAEASLEIILGETNSDGAEVEIYNPESFEAFGWKIVSFSNSGLPNSCSNLGWSNCLCICKSQLVGDNIEECDEEGICRESELIVNGGEIKIKNPPVRLEIKNKVI